GFSKTTPWLRLPHSYPRINVKVQQLDAFSILNFYKRLIEIRRQERALNVGDYRSVFSNKQIIAYSREVSDSRLLVVLNLSHRPYHFQQDGLRFQGTIELST